MSGLDRMRAGARTVLRRSARARAAWSAVPAGTGQDFRHGLRRLWRRPGFAAVALITLALPSGAYPSAAERPEIEFRRATDGYFEAMHIQVAAGRAFLAEDGAAILPVAVINGTAARRFWPDADPVGARIRPLTANPDATPWYEIVGVVDDVRHFGLDRDVRPEMYIPFAQGQPPGTPLIAIRTSGMGAALAGAVRARIRGLDPDIVVWNVATMSDRLGESVAARRFGSRLTAGFALGLVAAASLGRLIACLLIGVEPLDPITLAGVGAVLPGAAAAATYFPARRAARIDAMEVLRHE